MNRLALAILFCLLPGVALGATWYLRADGDDSDPDCSESSACCAGAMDMSDHNGDTFSAGDTIILCDDGGDYSTAMVVPSAGSDGSPITYEAASGDTPQLNAAITGSATLTANKNYITIIGLSIQVSDATLLTNGNMEAADPPSDWTLLSEAVLDGVADERTGGSGSQSMEITRGTSDSCARQDITCTIGEEYIITGWMKNTDATDVDIAVFDSGWGATGDSDDISSTSWTEMTPYTFEATDTTHIIILRVDGAQGEKGLHDDIAIGEYTDSYGIYSSGDNLSVSGCTVVGQTGSRNNPTGIEVSGDDPDIDNNTVHDCRVGIHFWTNTTKSGVCENNTVYDIGTEGDPSGGDGIRCTGRGDFDGFTVQKNEIYQWKDDAIDCYGGNNVLVQYNKIHDPLPGETGNGIKMGSAFVSGTTARYNHIYNLTNGTEKYAIIGNADELTVYGNIVDTATYGIFLYASRAPTSFSAFNNTVVNCTNAMNVGATNTGTLTVQNNILEGSNYDFTARSDVIGGYNCLKNDGSVEGEGSYTNTETSDLYSTDPLFTDAASDDFTLQSISPCINTGTDLGASYDDALWSGSVWPSNVYVADQDRHQEWEIGAYYYTVGQYPTYGAFSYEVVDVPGDRFIMNGPVEDVVAQTAGTEALPIFFMVYRLTGDFDLDSQADVIIQGVENVSGTISNPGTRYQGLYFSPLPGFY